MSNQEDRVISGYRPGVGGQHIEDTDPKSIQLLKARCWTIAGKQEENRRETKRLRAESAKLGIERKEIESAIVKLGFEVPPEPLFP